jgi:rhamnulose-1-phosphate aldolase
VHSDQVRTSDSNFHAIIHAQPPHLTFLSHIPEYQDTYRLNAALLRWQPETIIQFPEGIGFTPFQVPGSSALMQATIEGLRRHKLVVWSKHGVMARSDSSVTKASDLVEYAEAAARYEYLYRTSGQAAGAGLTTDEIRAICSAFGVVTSILDTDQ